MAADKPGLVEKLAAVVSNYGASWTESRLAKLGGQFTGIVRVELAQDNEQALRQALTALEDGEFKITLHSEAIDQASISSHHQSIDVLGNDRPGIVHELSRTLLKHRINVVELNSELRDAPMTGNPLFAAEVQISVPDDLNAEQFEEELEQIADELDLDIKLT